MQLRRCVLIIHFYIHYVVKNTVNNKPRNYWAVKIIFDSHVCQSRICGHPNERVALKYVYILVFILYFWKNM